MKYQVYNADTNEMIYESNYIEDANENIVNNDIVCYCKNTVTGCIEMDDRASRYYDDKEWEYEEDFNHNKCIEDINNLYGIDVANWVENIC